MSTSRDSAQQNESAQDEPQDPAATTTTESDAVAQKRKEHPTDDDNDSKRRQLTPPGENGSVAVKQEPPSVEDTQADSQTQTAATTTPTPLDHQELIQTSRTLLKTFTQTTFDYLTQIVSRPKSPKGMQYRTLYDRFKIAREHLPTDNNFVVIPKDQTFPGTDAFIRRTNAVTFIASMLGSRDASFRQLNHHFLTTFVKPSEPLTQRHADIWLGLRTQAYISQAMGNTMDMNEVLSQLFPDNMESKLLESSVDDKNSSSSNIEPTIVQQFADRRRDLSAHTTTEQVTALKQKYQWNKVLHKMMDLIRETYAELVEVPQDEITSLNDDGERQADITEPSTGAPTGPPRAMAANGVTADTSQATANNTNQQTPYQGVPAENPVISQEDADAAADQAAFAALRSFQMDDQQPNNGTLQNSATPAQQSLATANPSTAIPPQYALPNGDQYAQGPYAQQVPPPGYEASGQATYPGYQPQATARMYEQARQATNGRSSQSSASARRPAGQSQRRPWSQEEESALMTGLDAVKGPHWSHILQLYGLNGKVSDVLKDRNQVQLKDKARNLKLWFLKSGLEVPDSLKCVTGELKTRAPASVRNAAQQQAAVHTAQSSPVTQSQGPQNYHALATANPYSTAGPGVYAANTPPVTASTQGYTSAYVPVDAPTNDNEWAEIADSAAAAAAAVLADEDLQKLLKATNEPDPPPEAPETSIPPAEEAADTTEVANTVETAGVTAQPAELAADAPPDTNTNPTEGIAADAEAPAGFDWDDAAIGAAVQEAAQLGVEGFGDL